MSAHLGLEELSALLDGELERGRAEEARRHLEGCAECGERYAGMQRSVATLRGLASAPAPPEILHRIRRQTATIPANPSLLERLGDWLHPPALRPAFAAAFSLVFAAVLAVYGLNAYYTRQSAPVATSDQPLEAFLRSGVPPGPSGQRAATGGEAQAKETEKDKQELRALGYVAPAAPDSAAKKTAAAAAPARRPASEPAPAARMAQAPPPPGRGADKPALNASQDASAGRLAADAEGAASSSAEVATAAPAPAAPTAPAPEPELQKARAEETVPEATRERAKAATAPAAPSPTAAVAPQAEEFARRDLPERQIAGRAFTQTDGMWIERGIGAQASRAKIAANSPAGRELLRRMPELQLLLRDARVVVLRDGGHIVELRSNKLPAP